MVVSVGGVAAKFPFVASSLRYFQLSSSEGWNRKPNYHAMQPS
jgi:hypothetical protein